MSVRAFFEERKLRVYRIQYRKDRETFLFFASSNRLLSELEIEEMEGVVSKLLEQKTAVFVPCYEELEKTRFFGSSMKIIDPYTSKKISGRKWN